MAKGDKKYDQVASGLIERVTVARMALQGHLGSDPQRAADGLSSKSLELLKKERDAFTALLSFVTLRPADPVTDAPSDQ